MCGFIAIISPSLPIQDRMLSHLRDKLIHRGPDAGNNWISASKRIGMGHRRLSILDKSSAANQPMVGFDNASTLVFNGEIYNFIELREELKKKVSNSVPRAIAKCY